MNCIFSLKILTALLFFRVKSHEKKGKNSWKEKVISFDFRFIFVFKYIDFTESLLHSNHFSSEKIFFLLWNWNFLTILLLSICYSFLQVLRFSYQVRIFIILLQNRNLILMTNENEKTNPKESSGFFCYLPLASLHLSIKLMGIRLGLSFVSRKYIEAWMWKKSKACFISERFLKKLWKSRIFQQTNFLFLAKINALHKNLISMICSRVLSNQCINSYRKSIFRFVYWYM